MRCSEPDRDGDPEARRFLTGDSEEPDRGLLGRERGCELPRERDLEELDAEEEEEEREELSSPGLSRWR